VRLLLKQEAALVFALGLIHGMGFAAVLQTTHSAQRGLAVVAFNLGLESGQLLIALLLYTLIGLWRLTRHAISAQRAWQSVLSWLALGVGLFWLVERGMP
jgi:hypothetical protein